jgi:hypothetical protein
MTGTLGSPEATTPPAARLSHDQLVDRVMWEARRRKLKAHYCRSALRCTGPRGLPDLIIVGMNGMICAEIKSETGDTDAFQDEWIWYLTKAGIRTFVWRQADLDSGAIAAALEAIA